MKGEHSCREMKKCFSKSRYEEMEEEKYTGTYYAHIHRQLKHQHIANSLMNVVWKGRDFAYVCRKIFPFCISSNLYPQWKEKKGHFDLKEAL